MTNKERFKANMRFFEIEAHSYCNRKCWFCPNSFIDRQFEPVKFLDWGIYLQVLKDLASINYSRTMVFAGFSEPFSQIDTLEYIRAARDKLPNIMISASTNTDYLTPELVEVADKAGLNVIRAQLYFGKHENYTGIAIRKKMDILKAKIPNIDFKEKVELQWFALVGNLVIHAYSKNFHERGYNRCGVEVGKKRPPRIFTCCEPVTAMGINYNGWAVPCCQVRSDYPPHKDLLLGKMDDTPGKIFELYRGTVFPEEQAPCSMCGFLASHGNPQIIYTNILKEMKSGKDRSRTNRHYPVEVGTS